MGERVGKLGFNEHHTQVLMEGTVAIRGFSYPAKGVSQATTCHCSFIVSSLSRAFFIPWCGLTMLHHMQLYFASFYFSCSCDMFLLRRSFRQRLHCFHGVANFLCHYRFILTSFLFDILLLFCSCEMLSHGRGSFNVSTTRPDTILTTTHVALYKSSAGGRGRLTPDSRVRITPLVL